MIKEEEIIQHPAFGQVSFTRVQTNRKTPFYGSELSVDHYIELRVHTSELLRNLTDDRYHAKERILELRLTPNQFSELITSMNIGDGVPCTLEKYNGNRIQDIEFAESRKDFTHRQFQERMKQFANKLSENRNIAKRLIAKKTLSKEDQKALEWQIDWIIQETSSNIPFFAECFQEQMDKVVLEAKSEVEAAILHKITTLGLEALYEQNKLLK